MCANVNTLRFQPLLAQSTRNTQGGGNASGKMAAAGAVLVTAIFDLGGVVRVPWPGAVLQIGIIPGAGVVVADDGRNGCAAGLAVQQAAEEFRPVLLPPRGGKVVLPRCSALEELLQLL